MMITSAARPLLRPFVLSTALLGVTCVSGCLKPNPLLERQLDSQDEAIGDTGESETTAADSETETTAADSETETTAADSETADAETASDTDSCEIPQDFDPPCASCLGDACCDLVQACDAVPGCSCLAACLAAGWGNGPCKSQCDGAKPNKIPELGPVLDCTVEACPGSC